MALWLLLTFCAHHGNFLAAFTISPLSWNQKFFYMIKSCIIIWYYYSIQSETRMFSVWLFDCQQKWRSNPIRCSISRWAILNLLHTISLDLATIAADILGAIWWTATASSSFPARHIVWGWRSYYYLIGKEVGEEKKGDVQLTLHEVHFDSMIESCLKLCMQSIGCSMGNRLIWHWASSPNGCKFRKCWLQLPLINTIWIQT